MTASRWHYVKELSEQLRVNGVPEQRVRDIVAEVEGHVAATGEDPVVAFGQPVDYAAHWSRLSPRRWLAQLCLAAVVAVGIAAGVRAVFADARWGGLVAIRPEDAVQFVMMFCVLGVLPWTVGLRESRQRASRLGESTIPSAWPLRLAGALVLGVVITTLAWLADERAGAVVLISVPRWCLAALAAVGILVGFLMGPTPNSAGQRPTPPGERARPWRMRVRRAFINR